MPASPFKGSLWTFAKLTSLEQLGKVSMARHSIAWASCSSTCTIKKVAYKVKQWQKKNINVDEVFFLQLLHGSGSCSPSLHPPANTCQAPAQLQPLWASRPTPPPGQKLFTLIIVAWLRTMMMRYYLNSAIAKDCLEDGRWEESQYWQYNCQAGCDMDLLNQVKCDW